MDYNTTHPPVVLHPLSQEEFDELKQKLGGIRNHLPDNMMSYIWSNFNKIRGVSEPQPCGCASAAGHWLRAINELRAWVESKK
jgi:hypothetical protein